MTAGLISLGWAVFVATAILLFVGAFMLIMSVRLGTRLLVVHR